MSILIKGLDLPKENQRGLWVVIHADGIVEYNSGDEGWKTLKQAAYHVPPHGRLVDADILYRVAVDRAEKRGDMFNEMDNVLSPRCIKMTPTFIPAEREELDHEPPEG